MIQNPDRQQVAELLRAAGADKFPGHLDLELVEITEGAALMRVDIKPHHLAPNGYLHAGLVVSLADTAAGYGCVGNWPEGASGFTTIEMKANFFATLLEGTLEARATMIHGGRTTQVWDVGVVDQSLGKAIGAFRCTQMILYPRAD
ncbi:MAG: PaaI family thioesterase [Acidimicrobiia bacterium]|nr:PaaI family thioesterase [Acidimicrobiia bacterium]MDH3462781.1 PaaI family thioesterase [Acidimicrobiia bacterium]